MKNKRIYLVFVAHFVISCESIKAVGNLMSGGENDVQIVVSENVYTCDTRFFKAG